MFGDPLSDSLLDNSIGIVLALSALGIGLGYWLRRGIQWHRPEASSDRQPEDTVDLAFDLAPIGMAITGLDGRLLRVNRALCQLLDYSESELIDRPLAGITHPDDLDVDRALEWQLQQGKIAQFRTEKRYLARTGRAIDAILQVSLVRDGQGHPLHAIRQIVDISDRVCLETQLRRDVFYDSLTGLPNRTLFLQRLNRAADPTRSDQRFAVLFLDLDRFKILNDSLGHILGDRLLVEIGQRIRDCAHPEATVARMGGDEFTLLLERIESVEEAIAIARRIQQELSAPFSLNGQEIFTNASIGIALSSTGYDRAEDLLRNADIAMYYAKAMGQECYAVFDTDMHQRTVNLLQIETDLRRAISTNRSGGFPDITAGDRLLDREFELYYQPIVALDTGRITGFEALIRWTPPGRAPISPAEFIPVAEETGLIVPLGLWILRRACQQLFQWQQQFPAYPPLTMSVNLSGKQLGRSDFLPCIDRVLADIELPPDSLKLEITESVLMDNADVTAVLLEQLRKRNIQCCIDDFGTGYSSLSYLHRFPIGTLKVDRSFINTLGVDEENTELVRSILMLAHNLGMYVIAEGVETQQQLVQLWALECEFGQGYFFSPALQGAEATALLATSPQW